MTNCDVCHVEGVERAAYADAKISGVGSWFYLCREHFDRYRCTLGDGQGYRLDEEATVPTELQDRYNAVHAVIMAGPCAWLQESIDDASIWFADGRLGAWAMTALAKGVCVCAPEEHDDYYGTSVPPYWVLADEPGSRGSVANAEAYWCEAKVVCGELGADPSSPPTAC